jgi:hypothetical protein
MVYSPSRRYSENRPLQFLAWYVAEARYVNKMKRKLLFTLIAALLLFPWTVAYGYDSAAASTGQAEITSSAVSPPVIFSLSITPVKIPALILFYTLLTRMSLYTTSAI